jgi:uncharacterized membrane protein
MSKLESKLAQWVSAGFIDAKQASQIKTYEDSQSDNSWASYGLLILGVSIVGIGVISLIAANWENIPDMAKLIADFSVLLFFCACIVRASMKERALQFEILLFSFLILCLASIGLISQIYHSGGEFYEALMLWSLITAPVIFYVRNHIPHMVIPFFWLFGFFTGLIWTAYSSPLFNPVFNQNMAAIVMTVPLVFACLSLYGTQYRLADSYTRAIQTWFFISGFIAICTAEAGSNLFYATTTIPITPYYTGYALALLGILGILVHHQYHQAQKIVLTLAIGVFLLSFYLPMLGNISSYFYAFSTIVLMTLMAVFTASLAMRRLFQWLLFLIGLRFLILYFEALGGLALTGLGLIISGGLIISVATLWGKYKLSIAIWAERWMQ